jgi:CheY-like chemotaxis protein
MSTVPRRRILVVEDEALVAMYVEAILNEAGCEVVGPAASVDEALRLCACDPLDAAVLDVNLDGVMTFAVADALAAAHVPFVWLTGHSPEMLPERHRARPLVSKPYVPRALIEALYATSAPNLASPSNA